MIEQIDLQRAPVVAKWPWLVVKLSHGLHMFNFVAGCDLLCTALQRCSDYNPKPTPELVILRIVERIFTSRLFEPDTAIGYKKKFLLAPAKLTLHLQSFVHLQFAPQ